MNPEEIFILSKAVGLSKALDMDQNSEQVNMTNRSTLPIKCLTKGGEDKFKEWGVEFGEVCEYNDLFRHVIFPEGWQKEPSEYSGYVTNIKDEKGLVRGTIFYKSAFYDRAAHYFVKMEIEE